MKNRIWVLSFLLIMISAISCVKSSQKKFQWHHPLYMANNDYWRQRIPVSLKNNTHREILGDIVEVRVGNKSGQAPLTGALAEGVRVTTAQGDELMYRISSQDGKLIEKGPVPENSKIIFPVECKADSRTVNYIYFDNLSAWPVGDYLKTNININDSISPTVLNREKLSLTQKGKPINGLMTMSTTTTNGIPEQQ